MEAPGRVSVLGAGSQSLPEARAGRVAAGRRHGACMQLHLATYSVDVPPLLARSAFMFAARHDVACTALRSPTFAGQSVSPLHMHGACGNVRGGAELSAELPKATCARAVL